jgi:DNA-binding response OmpR family regulator
MENTSSTEDDSPMPAGARATSLAGNGDGLSGHPRVLVFGESSTVSRVFLQELQRAGYGAVEGPLFEDLHRSFPSGRVHLALILVDIPPSKHLEVVRWFRINQPGVKLLLAWEGHWGARTSIRDLDSIPELVMPFTTEDLVAKVHELLADGQAHRPSGQAVPAP